MSAHAFQEAVEAVRVSVGSRRVTPVLPVGRQAMLTGEQATPVVEGRDDASSWSAFLEYADADGVVTRRRFTVRKISGAGAATHVSGFCHERKAPRMFAISRIQELVCCDTGEVLDPERHFTMLRMTGALPVEDKTLADICRIAIFLARCDGVHHALEREAVETMIERYCLRFDGTDRMVSDTLGACGKMAPDAEDLIKALTRISRGPDANRIAKFVLDSGAAIVAADGVFDDEEMRWAHEVSSALKHLAV